jgi:hypothetical protein
MKENKGHAFARVTEYLNVTPRKGMTFISNLKLGIKIISIKI